MGNPVCDRATLMADSGCFLNPPLDSPLQLAMKIYFKAAQLKAIGGKDYTSALSTTLVSDSACIKTLYPDQRDAIRLAIEFNHANSAGAALSSAINTLMQAIACLKNVDANTMEVMDIWLTCQLGYGHAYPQ